jgi:hypothetical protein
MQHRAAQRADPPAAPRNQHERTIYSIQRRIARTVRQVRELEETRDNLALALWTERGTPQAEITALLDQADREGGGSGVTYAAVQKRLHRRRT